MNVFLIGMSGIGMQAIAAILKKSGANVSGWDDGKQLDSLKSIGIQYTQTIPDDTDFVVFSSIIKNTHELIISAKNKNIKCLNRTDFTIEHIPLNAAKILVAGAHGKTTTSSFIAHILDKQSYLLGGIINGEKFSGHTSQGLYTAIETDESDGSFLKWSVNLHGQLKYKILVNFDFEHMDYFKTEQNCIEQYRKFIMDDLENSFVIIEYSAKEFLEIPNHPNIITFGPQIQADYVFNNVEFLENGIQFEINNNQNNEKIFIPLFGTHNASNFTALYALMKKLDIQEIAQKASQFPGVKKRMQPLEMKNGYKMYLDYGHHPKEVEAVLDALYLHKKMKLDVVIEFHKYTRLEQTWSQWPAALKNAKKIYILPIHTASEDPIPGIDEAHAIAFLKENKLEVCELKSIYDYVPTNDTICFSAGKLSELLS
jgi:UDP-N-acetylmuramate--alanine ligase